MIFLTVGTQLPFDRLTRALDAWAAAHSEQSVFGQIADPGAEGYRPQHFEWTPFLGPDEIEGRFSQAEVIVGHAGMGTIIGALSRAKPLLIMPRRAHLREQRNDHQFATVGRFGSKPGVCVAHEEPEVGPMLDTMLQAEAGTGAAIAAGAEPRLIEALRGFIFEKS